MDPAKKRTTRLVIALSCALLLACALVYTSFSASSEARQPSELAAAQPGETYQLTGRVAKGSWENGGTVHTFAVEDRDGGGPAIPVTYRGSVPDPFREGREIVIDVRKEGSAFVGQPDSLVTKCPSKFTAEPKSS